MLDRKHPTLVASLEARAGVTKFGYHHHTREGQPPEFVAYGELLIRARRVAAALQERGLRKGDRVGLILPDSAQFVDSIYGAMIAGVIPVPVYPPLSLGQLDAYLDNTTHILRRAGCKLVVTDARVRPILGKLMSDAPELREIVVQSKLVGTVPERAEPRPVDVRPDDIAFLQFTSGSTSRPKGVMLTHSNLAANIRAIGGDHGLRLNHDSSAVSWLPLYHDMGLIGFVFTPIYYPTRGIEFLSPLMFLKRPSVWLRRITEFKPTISFAPNFAWGLATKRIKDRELEGVDLSSLIVAGCGAEPIQFHTLNGFAKRFAPYGFKRTAFLPCYGMAEHTLAITFIGLDEDLKAERVDAEALAAGEARPVPEDAEAAAAEERDGADGKGVIRVVSCGTTFPEHELKIAEADGTPLPERRVGHIMLRGPSITQGYFEDSEATDKAFVDGWLETGDLGYLADGELYVCGRSKDLIIVNGRNFHPQDIEWQASQVDGVRTGNVIAFSLDDAEAGRERVVLVCETKQPEEEHAALRKQVKGRVLEALALRVDEIVMLPPGSLPKTSSGKLQRSKASEMFRSATLGKGGQGGSLGLLKQLASSRWNYIKSSLRKRS